MFGLDESCDAHQEVYGSGDYENPAKFSYELITGATAFQGHEAVERSPDERRQRTLIPPQSLHRPPRNSTDPLSPHQKGKHVSDVFAKELLAGIVDGEIDKLAEIKGIDFYNREKAQHYAKNSADRMYNEHYGDMNNYGPEQRDRPNFRY